MTQQPVFTRRCPPRRNLFLNSRVRACVDSCTVQSRRLDFWSRPTRLQDVHLLGPDVDMYRMSAQQSAHARQTLERLYKAPMRGRYPSA
mgnify:CR=1 FL=1